jgi:MoxR-like ATPase
LGTAFLPSALPRVLLIDEIDKSDINLPNDLLNLFEEGEYEIPELKRWTKKNPGKTVSVFTDDRDISIELDSGIVGCQAFPIVVMTSNGERDFPPAFKRRCIRINMPNPGINNLTSIVKAHMGERYFHDSSDRISQLIKDFLDKKDLATDQLLNVVYMLTGGTEFTLDRESLKELLFKSLNDTEGL